MDQDATWYGVGLGPGHTVLHGYPDPLPYCAQTAGWIKMPLDTNTGLGPGRIVLHGTQVVPLPKGAQPTIFGPCLLWPNGRPSQLLLSSCLPSLIPLDGDNWHRF